MKAALAAALVAAATLAPAPARPQGVPCRATLQPPVARLGEPVTYRGSVLVPKGTAFRWLPPANDGAFEWGTPRIRRIPYIPGAHGREPDTLAIEVPLQAFAVGLLRVPGIGFQLRAPGSPVIEARLPTIELAIEPTVPPEDSTADLRPARGPFAAPWWERIRWWLVAAGALALLAAGLVVRRLRRRAPAPAPAFAPPPHDPARDALAALEALRGLHLPEHGRFAEHAFHLTRILRRYLEATEGAPRPGDSTPELLGHLPRLAAADVERLGALLAAWDRVKFARAASTAEEAWRAEHAVAAFVRRRGPRAEPGREAA